MARDKAKDDKYFNCSQDAEHAYVVSLYNAEQRPNVRAFLKTACANSTIYYSTHTEVYTKIRNRFGYPIPG